MIRDAVSDMMCEACGASLERATWLGRVATRVRTGEYRGQHGTALYAACGACHHVTTLLLYLRDRREEAA